MELLKEDGSLDIERINKLPITEFMDVIGDLTEEQFKEYMSKLQISESNEPIHSVMSLSLQDELAKGTIVSSEGLINNWKKNMK